MRDILTDFGVVKTTAATEVAFPNGVDAGAGGNLGKICPLFIHVKVEGSTAVPAAEELEFTVKDKDTTGAGDDLLVYKRPASALAVGGDIVFKLPADHRRYLSLGVTADTTANISLHAWLEEGERK